MDGFGLQSLRRSFLAGLYVFDQFSAQTGQEASIEQITATTSNLESFWASPSDFFSIFLAARAVLSWFELFSFLGVLVSV